jgi:hypothetical protein
VPAGAVADVDAARFVEEEAETLAALSWSFDERPSVRMLAGFFVVLLVLGALDVEIDPAGEFIEYGDDGGLSRAEGSSSGTPVRPRKELDSVPLGDFFRSLLSSGKSMDAGGRGWEDERVVELIAFTTTRILNYFRGNFPFSKIPPSPQEHHHAHRGQIL